MDKILAEKMATGALKGSYCKSAHVPRLLSLIGCFGESCWTFPIRDQGGCDFDTGAVNTFRIDTTYLSIWINNR